MAEEKEKGKPDQYTVAISYHPVPPNLTSIETEVVAEDKLEDYMECVVGRFFDKAGDTCSYRSSTFAKTVKALNMLNGKDAAHGDVKITVSDGVETYGRRLTVWNTFSGQRMRGDMVSDGKVAYTMDICFKKVK